MAVKKKGSKGQDKDADLKVVGSVAPDAADTAGGLWTGRGTIVRARWIKGDYGGRRTDQHLALALKIKTADGEIQREEISAGSLERLVPHNDGRQIAIPPESTATGRRNATITIAGNDARYAITLGEVAIPTTDPGPRTASRTSASAS